MKHWERFKALEQELFENYELGVLLTTNMCM
jgi:hypothetical protein